MSSGLVFPQNNTRFVLKQDFPRTVLKLPKGIPTAVLKIEAEV
jgi:hypothetical protein